MVIARTGDPANAYKVGRMMGGELRALGINLDCAPVLDTLSGPAERRYYGQTVQSIADYGCAMARGLRDAGVLACGKHFPGHEQTGADTHFGFVVDNTPRDTLMNSCLTPFCRAMSEDLASVMVSHVCFPALDDTDTPCSMSAPVIQGVLRGQLGYQGLVISDGLQMHAILDQYGAPQGCVQAALAGCDLLIIGNGGDNADPTGKDVQTPCIRALCDAVPMEPCRWRGDESVRRILACKLALGWTMPARDAASQDWSNHAALADAFGRNRRDGTRPPRPAAAARRDVIYCAGVGTGTGVTEAIALRKALLHWLHGVWAASALSTTRWKNCRSWRMSAPRRPRWYSPLAPVRKPPLPPRPPKRWLRTTRASVLSAWPSRTLCSTIPLLPVP